MEQGRSGLANDQTDISITEMFDLFCGTVPDVVRDFVRNNRSPDLPPALRREILDLLGAAYRQGKVDGKATVCGQLRRAMARLNVLERREEEINSNLFEWQMEEARRGNATMLIWLDRKMNGDPDCRDDDIKIRLSDLAERIRQLEDKN